MSLRSLLPRVFRVSLFLLLPLAPSVHAQWQTTAFSLRGGWNSIYLHGDATHATPEQHFAANPEIVAVWRWNPNVNSAGSAPTIPATNSPEWSIWRRGNPAQTTLSQLTGRTAYLIECTGSLADTYTLQLTSRPLPPASTWVRNGANLLGFPTRSADGAFPTFSAYFATFPAAVAAGSRIYRYTGGPLDDANPAPVFALNAERIDRNQAYWFETPVVGDFYAPLEITPSNADGLHYGRSGSSLTVRVRNRTSSPITLTVQSQISASPPTGQEAIAGPVTLKRRGIDATGAFVFSPVTAFNEVIPAQTATDLVFVVDRGAMPTGSDALYASLLRFTESANLADIVVPVSARPASLTGLWVGDVAVNAVQSFAPGSPGATTSRPFPLRVILHVDQTGTARLLSQVFLGQLAAPPNLQGLATMESALKADAKASATRLVAAHLPPDTVAVSGSGSVALDGTLVRTLTVPFDAPTNPFVHTYHPDHDNRDARLQPLPAGVESPTFTRTLSFTFSPNPPASTNPVGWGTTVLGGTFGETITGVHRNPLVLSGTFELRRVSDLGDLTLN